MKKIEIEIPIYRAKKIDSDDNIKSQSYIKKLIGGNYHHYLVKYYSPDYEDVEIDPSTLAIHFYDMLDRQENKIFASLSEDGKGGDILEWTIFPDDMPKLRINGVPYYSKGGAFKVTGRIEMMWHLLAPHKECKIIGIQEWKNTYYYHYY